MDNQAVELKLKEAVQKSTALQHLAETLESRIMTLESVTGKPPTQEVAQVLAEYPPLPAGTDVKVRVAHVNKKSNALESLAQKLEQRIMTLEASMVVSGREAPKEVVRSLQEPRVALAKPEGKTGCIAFIQKLACCCSSEEEVRHREISGEKYQQAASASEFTHERMYASVYPVLMELQKLSDRLEMCANPLAARGAARAIQPSVEMFHEDGKPHGIVEKKTPYKLPQQAPSVDVDEIIQRERAQAEATLSQHKQAHSMQIFQHQTEIAQLQGALQTANAMQLQEQQSRTGYEVQLQQSSERDTYHQQTIADLQAQLANAHAAVTAQRADNAQAAVAEQHAVMAEQHAAMAQQLEAYQQEVLIHKQRALENEEGFTALSNDNAILQQSLQEHQEALRVNTEQFDQERRQQSEQIVFLQGKIVDMEAQQALATVMTAAAPEPVPATVSAAAASPARLTTPVLSPAKATEVVSPQVISPLPQVSIDVGSAVSPSRQVTEGSSPTPATATLAPTSPYGYAVSQPLPLGVASSGGGAVRQNVFQAPQVRTANTLSPGPRPGSLTAGAAAAFPVPMAGMSGAGSAYQNLGTYSYASATAPVVATAPTAPWPGGAAVVNVSYAVRK